MEINVIDLRTQVESGRFESCWLRSRNFVSFFFFFAILSFTLMAKSSGIGERVNAESREWELNGSKAVLNLKPEGSD